MMTGCATTAPPAQSPKDGEKTEKAATKRWNPSAAGKDWDTPGTSPETTWKKASVRDDDSVAIPLDFEVNVEPTLTRFCGIDVPAVFFETDSAKLNDEGRMLLDEINQCIESKAPLEDAIVEVTGHADARGTKPYNRGLSKDRARTIVDYMTENGPLTDERVIYIAAGEQLADGGNEPDKRKVELRLRPSSIDANAMAPALKDSSEL